MIRKLSLVAVMAMAALVMSAPSGSAGGCRGGNRGHSRCHSRGHKCHNSSCTTSCTTYSTAPCSGSPAPAPKPMPQKHSQAEAAEATIVVNLPADAKLTFDDQETTSTSETRVFVTPILDAGRDFHYTVKAEIVRDGTVHTMVREIAVSAGAQTEVNFEAPVQAAAAE